jgi:integrative and conjugative element protein (TIGR02256 family)
MCADNHLRPRCFALPHCKQQLVFGQAALEIFSKYRQQEMEPESGGLLFAEFAFPLIQIVEVSAPHATDRRWRTLFIPNRILQRQLIRQCFKKGLHFVGEWHTHPEPKPTPSGLDLKSMGDAFVKSRHELNYFIMAIVGNRRETLELWVSAHDGASHHRLRECVAMKV